MDLHNATQIHADKHPARLMIGYLIIKLQESVRSENCVALSTSLFLCHLNTKVQLQKIPGNSAESAGHGSYVTVSLSVAHASIIHADIAV